MRRNYFMRPRRRCHNIIKYQERKKEKERGRGEDIRERTRLIGEVSTAQLEDTER